MRIATYHRVSTLDQNADAARADLRAFAGRLGGTIAIEVEEVGSGARNDRPGLQRVLEAARKRAVDCLVVWKLDRLGRSTLDLHTNAALLETYGVRLACVTQAIDTATPTGKLLFTVLSAVAEFERDSIKERTHLGLRRAIEKGKTLGRPRVPCPAEQILAMKAAGKTKAQIVRELDVTWHAVRRAVETVTKASGS